MDLENINALADILNAKGLSAIEVGDGENRIRIEKETASVSMFTQPASLPVQPQPVTSEATGVETPVPSSGSEPDSHYVDFSRLIEIKSPLVGVYYAAPSPDSETFVSIGSKVKKDDVLCIIETMKLMNEITAEQDGEIVDICIKNGDIAEYGQVLFKMF